VQVIAADADGLAGSAHSRHHRINDLCIRRKNPLAPGCRSWRRPAGIFVSTGGLWLPPVPVSPGRWVQKPRRRLPRCPAPPHTVTPRDALPAGRPARAVFQPVIAAQPCTFQAAAPPLYCGCTFRSRPAVDFSDLVGVQVRDEDLGRSNPNL